MLHWHTTALTLFPEMFPGFLGHSLAGRALENGLWQLETVQIRDFALDKHQNVDDKPFGGGIGMVMRPDVLAGAIDHVLQSHPQTHLVYPSPRGIRFTQKEAKRLIASSHVTFLCGRFEGIDERVLEHYAIEEISLGDFVLSGGEVAALAMMDACVRLLPGVIQTEGATEEESFGDSSLYDGLLEYPHYPRPASWQGMDVPEVLLSGNHAKIQAWRLQQAKQITQKRRPDLLK